MSLLLLMAVAACPLDTEAQVRPRPPSMNHGAFLRTLRVCTLGFGSLNHGIWPLVRVFGAQNLGLQTLRVQTTSL